MKLDSCNLFNKINMLLKNYISNVNNRDAHMVFFFENDNSKISNFFQKKNTFFSEMIYQLTTYNHMFSVSIQNYLRCKIKKIQNSPRIVSRTFLTRLRIEIMSFFTYYCHKNGKKYIRKKNLCCFNFLQIVPKTDLVHISLISKLDFSYNSVKKQTSKYKIQFRLKILKRYQNKIEAKIFNHHGLVNKIYIFDIKKINLISNGITSFKCINSPSSCSRNSYLKKTWICYLEDFLSKLNIISNHLEYFEDLLRKKIKVKNLSFKKIDVFLNRFLAFNSFGFYQVNKGLVCSFEILPSKKKIPLKLSFRIKITNKLFKKKKLCYETRKKFTGRDKFSIENNRANISIRKEDFDFFSNYHMTEEAVCQNKNSGVIRKSDFLLKLFTKESSDFHYELIGNLLCGQFEKIFRENFVKNWLSPILICCSRSNTGLAEIISGSKSLHRIKFKDKVYNLSSGKDMKKYETILSKKIDEFNFSESLSGYSLFCFLLQIKDRHNGNILYNKEGRLLHIDFGFIMNLFPGNINMEAYSFKMTDFFILKLGGIKSEIFETTRENFIRGLLVLRKNFGKINKLLRIFTEDKNLSPKIMNNLLSFQRRFLLKASDREIIKYSLDLFKESMECWKTRQYDIYQQYASGIR